MVSGIYFIISVFMKLNPNSIELHNFRSGYGQQEFWTSGSNNNRNLAWTWESTGVPFSYVKWEPSQMTGASNAFQRNAVFNRVRHQGAAWSSAYAHELHFSICESGQFSF